jgi:hypothetical protein
MNQFGWIVIVVFVGIWIINSFLRNAAQERTTNRQRTGSDGASEGPSTRRPKTEIEQFLEEVNRRRRQKEGRQTPPREEEQRPLKTPLATRQSRQSAGETRRPKPASRGRTVPEREPLRALPVADAVVLATASRPAVGQSTLGRMLPAREAPPAPAPATLSQPELRNAPLNELTALINSTEGMRVAIILQEILGPPRCRRYFP